MNNSTSRIKAAVLIACSLAVPAEGLRRIAYNDAGGILTVCYGSTKDVQTGKVYSLDECRERLDKEMLAAVEAVERCAPGLPNGALAAFSDAVYNLGPKIACDTQKSTAARLLKAGKIGEACAQLPRWNKANIGGVMVELPGLKKRRQAEYVMCMRGLS